MENNPNGYYEILGLSISASKDDIKKAFRKKAHELHPDKNTNLDTTEEFQLLNEAFEVLMSLENDNKIEMNSKKTSSKYYNNEQMGKTSCPNCNCILYTKTLFGGSGKIAIWIGITFGLIGTIGAIIGGGNGGMSPILLFVGVVSLFAKKYQCSSCRTKFSEVWRRDFAISNKN
ncbi:MAG: hypothetical protein COA44_00345 [Arcobacter sp.]|nr:MAG: hypothetical protein COA44_00345 [Arcobacter sp.]